MLHHTKRKILMTIYKESQNPIPKIDNVVKPDLLGVEPAEFIQAVEELEKEKMIIGTLFFRGGKANKAQIAYFDKTSITQKGINEIESKL